jgi:small subunit ribosomal protein S16
VAVRIRMKKFGRLHRPFFRICAIDQQASRNARVIEELGTYDPIVPEVDARAILKGERVAYWLGVGALPSDKVRVLIKKYGAEGTHVAKQAEALARLAQQRSRPEPPTVMPNRKQAAAEAVVEPAPAEQASE